MRRIERRQPRPQRRLDPGDVLRLAGEEALVVPDDPDAVRRLETYLALSESPLAGDVFLERSPNARGVVIPRVPKSAAGDAAIDASAAETDG